MNWLYDKEAKKSIIISVIASALFLIFIQPIMLIIWEIVKPISFSAFDSIINSIYKNAALGQRNWLDFLIWAFILLFAFNYIIKAFLKGKRIVKELEDDEKLELMSLEEKENYLREQEAKDSSKIKILMKLTRFNWLIMILAGVSSLSLLFSTFTDLQLNTSFNQRLNAIAPYIDDSDIKILKSKWALMKTRQDYMEINHLFENLANGKGIILPNNLLD